MARPSWIGHKLGGRYQIEELLGEGGMASVYKATDPNLHRVVAVKLIHPHLSSEDSFVRRFEAEAAAVAQLRHPNIIQVFDFAQDDGVFYIVFEFLAGESLQAFLKRLDQSNRRFSYEEIVKIGGDILSALDYAHSRGLVHRDVKPANVMVNFSGNAILMDFGIVKITGGPQHTATGAILGTASYMSPEQIRGESADHRTDIYAAGIILFQMITGQPPYTADSAMTLMMKHVNDPVPDLRELRQDVPQDLVRIVTRALRKDRASRYQSAAEMLNDLRAARLTPAGAANYPADARTVLEQPARADASTVLETPPLPSPEPRTVPPRTGAPQPVPPRNAPSTRPNMRATTGQRSAQPAARREDSMLSRLGERRTPLIAGCLAVLLIFLCAGAAFALFGTSFGDELLGRSATPEPTTVLAEVTAAATQPDNPTSDVAANTPQSELPSDTPPPIDTPAPTSTVEQPTLAPSPTQQVAPSPSQTVEQPTLAPSPTSPPPTDTPAPAGYSVAITNIGLDGSTYIVDYSTTGYTEVLPGMHVHFFFNTVPPEQAGVPGSGPWVLWGGPRPFNAYTTGDRPAAATHMCALVANADHSVIANSGNCFALP